MKQTFIFLIFALLMTCYSKKQSNFDISLYEGMDFSGNRITLKDLPLKRIALNVYAPTCIPCVKEIPTLNYLYKEMSSDKSLGFYMAVDPFDIVPDAESSSTFEELFPKAKALMEKEVVDKKIELPILIMRKPFRISQGDGLITGRPETLLFKTNPLILYYNFIGSISEEIETEHIQNANKVKFFKLMLTGY